MAKDVTVSKWRLRVRAQERSGLTQKAWCDREGVALSSLALWRKRFRDGEESAVGDSGQPLVPIVVRDSAPLVMARSADGSGLIEIESGALRLRAGAGVDPRWLGSLLRELRG